MAEPPGNSQYDAEAAYVYNFAKFIRWPQTASGTPFAICVLGASPFSNTLQGLVANESIGNRPLKVKIVLSAQEAQSCSILFFPGRDKAERDRILAVLRGKPVLTVCDSPAFLESGGIIQFIVRDGRVRFSVNLNAANEDGLEISSQLLKIAVSVIGKPSPEAPK